VTLALTIPDIVENEPMSSLATEPDGVTFRVVIAIGETAVRLTRAAQTGEELPLVILTTDRQVVALDSVYVAGAVSRDSTSGEALVELTFVAREVRLV
jgi:hypothetical protein